MVYNSTLFYRVVIESGGKKTSYVWTNKTNNPQEFFLRIDRLIAFYGERERELANMRMKIARMEEKVVLIEH